MTFKVQVVRSAVMVGLALLASCGGGTQIESFAPRRVIAFGDEASLINTDSKKYTVNGVEFDTTVTPSVPKPGPVLVCTSNQVWVQQLAYSYGLAFDEGRCPGTGTTANGRMLATDRAKAAGLNGQIDTFLSSIHGPFTNTDLVTVMVGVHDVFDAAANAADPVAAVELAGTRAGEAVVRITDRGAKVIVSTIPDVGFTPEALRLDALTPGKASQLSTLTKRFNEKLRLKLQDVRDGGRAVGLVLADEQVLAMRANPGAYGLTNVTQAACNPAPANELPNCDATTLVTGAQATYAGDWLWADGMRLGANAQSRIGSLAVNRARSNPF